MPNNDKFCKTSRLVIRICMIPLDYDDYYVTYEVVFTLKKD